MNIVGVIQARLGSTRLPRKVLKPLLGQPMLWHIVERCKRVHLLNEIVVAAPMQDAAEISHAIPGVKVLSSAKVKEDDLVGRFMGAAEASTALLLVRICADNPCIDPENIDLLVESFVEQGYDKHVMGSNVGDWKSSKWPQGLGAEIYSVAVLQWMDTKLETQQEREHPHKYFHDSDKVWEPKCPLEWATKERFDVNTPEDLVCAEDVYTHFGNNTFSAEQLRDYVEHGRDTEYIPTLTWVVPCSREASTRCESNTLSCMSRVSPYRGNSRSSQTSRGPKEIDGKPG